MNRPPVKIDAAFEDEAKAMSKAMETRELPPTTAPFYSRVRALSKMYWDQIDAREREKARAAREREEARRRQR